eukprot:TRINITY_DN2901_c0_g3_i1.p1 TRINITY_DN2901_c0_g3~~TRINITY_DN2901_c0_g3_i1.p1  ORF type:complete len:296 (+),score=36.34 TRINITY_DN2901_c0_g3_i1:118-1005(+)
MAMSPCFFRQRWHKFSLLHAVLITFEMRWAAMGSDSPSRHQAVSIMGRNAYVYKPSTLFATGPVPAIFVLHGSAADAASMFEVGFEEFADVHNFLVVYPEMQVPKSAEWAYHDDIPYLDALSKHLQENFGLDGSRAYVCGHSAGGSMSLFLQNEADTFSAAAAVEAAPGQLHKWNMTRTGHRTMIIWNHADPVLLEYAPERNETQYYNMAVDVLRRHGSRTPAAALPLSTNPQTLAAEIRKYEEDASPELVMLGWRSSPGTHTWPKAAEFSFDAAHILTTFFLQVSETQPLVIFA